MINAALEIGATTRDAEAIDRVIRLVEKGTYRPAHWGPLFSEDVP